MPRRAARLVSLSALIACALPLAAMAQSMPSGGASGSNVGSGAGGGGGAQSDSGGSGRGSRDAKARRTTIEPYIEAGQVVTAELSPGDEVLTYSVIAAGLDAEIAGANNAASVSIRYEHRFGWGRAGDNDTLSGLARGYTTIAPGLQLNAGGLAARSRLERNGSAVLGPLQNDASTTQIYSLYAGPSLSTYAGDVGITANYQIGYTKVETADSFTPAPDAPGVDVFDDSVVHMANVRAGVKPYDILPVGLGVGAGFYQEDISNLDQRVRDFNARADVTVPLTQSLAAVGGVGYENVRISSRDAVRDINGLPVFGPGGRYITDKSEPRQIAYDVDGLIWDVGVMWRPSRRTALEAHVGRRYGSTSVYGSFAYTPSERSSLNISVYDNVAGFGGQVNRALADLPSEFTAVRNPLSGNLGGCVEALEKGSCLANVLGSVRSSTFRARGVMATYAHQFGRFGAGIGGGYDRRKFIAAQGTVLAGANGLVDENYWLAAYLNARIDERSSISTNLYANWFQTRIGLGGDSSALGATAAYFRNLTDKLSATAAVGLDGVNREAPESDYWTASALLGLRYSFF